MKITNKLGLPDALVQAVKNDLYTAGKATDISVTRLIGPPKIRVLQKRHIGEITEDVSDRLWALYGQAAHHIAERSESKGLKEERLYYTDLITGKTLSGQFDILEDGVLSDFKMTSVWAVLKGCKPEWEAQLNVLCFLARHNDLDVGRLQIIALLKDWRRNEAKYKPEMPQAPVKVVDVPMWSDKLQDAYIKIRIKLHMDAEETGILPDCTDDERWCVPGKFAVMKKGRKSAVRLLDTMEQAEAYIKDNNVPTGYVTERETVYNRCRDYCSISNFCSQYQEG